MAMEQRPLRSSRSQPRLCLLLRLRRMAVGGPLLQIALREDFEGKKAANSAEAVLEVIGRVEDRHLRTLLKKLQTEITVYDFQDNIPYQISYLFFSKTCSIKIEKFYFPSNYKEEKLNLHNCYCVVMITERALGCCYYFKRLLKNYREEIIDKLTFAEGVYQNYQLASVSFKKGEIEFNLKAHTIQLKSKLDLARGEPLTLNFSNNTFAIPGLHFGEGMGITFDEKFSLNVYQWICKCQEVVDQRGLTDFTFAIIQCANFMMECSEIICLSNLVHNYSFTMAQQRGKAS